MTETREKRTVEEYMSPKLSDVVRRIAVLEQIYGGRAQSSHRP